MRLAVTDKQIIKEAYLIISTELADSVTEIRNMKEEEKESMQDWIRHVMVAKNVLNTISQRKI